MIEFDWSIPLGVLDQAGQFEFSICLFLDQKDAGARIWYSDTCAEFEVGTTLINPDW
jgi:hypothetical protein